MTRLTTGSILVIWVFVTASLSFIGYCYMLAWMRAPQSSCRYAHACRRAA